MLQIEHLFLNKYNPLHFGFNIQLSFVLTKSKNDKPNAANNYCQLSKLF